MNRLNDYTKLMKMYGGAMGLNNLERPLLDTRDKCIVYKTFLETLTAGPTRAKGAKNSRREWGILVATGTANITPLTNTWEHASFIGDEYYTIYANTGVPGYQFDHGQAKAWVQAKIRDLDALIVAFPPPGGVGPAGVPAAGANALTQAILNYIAEPKAMGAVANAASLRITAANVNDIQFNLLVVYPVRVDSNQRVNQVIDELYPIADNMNASAATRTQGEKLLQDIGEYQTYASQLN